MKNLFSILFMLTTFSLAAQDIIIKNDGSEISAKVLEISKTEVRFKKMDNVDGPTYVESVSDLLMIRPSKGANIVFKKEVVKPEPPEPTPTNLAARPPSVSESVAAKSPVSTPQSESSTSNSEDTCEKGTEDAKKFYDGKNSGAGWVAATSILLSPLAGGATGILIEGAKPRYENLNLPKPSLVNSSNYIGCYQNEAHKTKKKKVWTSFGIGSFVWLLIIAATSTPN